MVTNGNLRIVEPWPKRAQPWKNYRRQKGCTWHERNEWKSMKAKNRLPGYWRVYVLALVTLTEARIIWSWTRRLTMDKAILLLPIHGATYCKSPWRNFACCYRDSYVKDEMPTCARGYKGVTYSKCGSGGFWTSRAICSCLIMPKSII